MVCGRGVWGWAGGVGRVVGEAGWCVPNTGIMDMVAQHAPVRAPSVLSSAVASVLTTAGPTGTLSSSLATVANDIDVGLYI